MIAIPPPHPSISNLHGHDQSLRPSDFLLSPTRKSFAPPLRILQAHDRLWNSFSRVHAIDLSPDDLVKMVIWTTKNSAVGLKLLPFCLTGKYARQVASGERVKVSMVLDQLCKIDKNRRNPTKEERRKTENKQQKKNNKTDTRRKHKRRIPIGGPKHFL